MSPPSDAVAAEVHAPEDEAFHELLVHARGAIDERLSSLFASKTGEAAQHGADVLALTEAVRDLTMRGGKRFRPALALAAYRAIDDEADETPALEAGVALELLQTYLLVHDDFIDGDDLRRGGPTVHVMLERHFASASKGQASAILAGDWAAALALEALARVDVANERLAKAFAIFSRIQQDAIQGQQLDIAGRPESVETMHDLKTGSYTVRGPLLLGSVLAGASPEQAAMLERFARPLGIAFQLRDDLLGAFGDPGTTGKPQGSDIRSGKKTALAALALANASSSQNEKLARTLGNQTASDEEVREVVAIYESSGARAEVERRLAALVDEAITELDGSKLKARGRLCLVGSARALTSRRS